MRTLYPRRSRMRPNVAWLAVLSLFYAFDLPLGPGAAIHGR
ncbi:hypothetical protein [Nonomuraea sp. B19D2]